MREVDEECGGSSRRCSVRWGMSREALWEVRMLRYAFFADFKGGLKLLTWGDKSGMTALSQFLREMAIAPREVELSERLLRCGRPSDRGALLQGPLRSFKEDFRRSTNFSLGLINWMQSGSPDWSTSRRIGTRPSIPRDRSRPPKALSIMVSIGEYPDHLDPRRARIDGRSLPALGTGDGVFSKWHRRWRSKKSKSPTLPSPKPGRETAPYSVASREKFSSGRR